MHLVSRFGCNTWVIVNTNSNPPLSHDKFLQQNLELNQKITFQRPDLRHERVNQSNGNSQNW